jgi:hypothetical protein
MLHLLRRPNVQGASNSTATQCTAKNLAYFFAGSKAVESVYSSDVDEGTHDSLQTSSPWEKAFDATMESNAATRLKGLKALVSLLQLATYKDAVRMCVLI